MSSRGCAFEYEGVRCPGKHSARGYCQAHFQQQHRGEELRPLKVFRTTCSLDWCDRPHSGLGYCEVHREQLKAGRPFSPIKAKRVQAATCLHCDQKPKARDLCAKHYGEMTRRASGMLPRPVRESLIKAAPRVTSDKPKRNPKSDPSRNPKLPRGWDAVKVKTPAVRKQTSSNGDMSGDFGPVPPIDQDLAAYLRGRLEKRNLPELAEMLGVAS